MRWLNVNQMAEAVYAAGIQKPMVFLDQLVVKFMGFNDIIHIYGSQRFQI